MAIKTLFRS